MNRTTVLLARTFVAVAVAVAWCGPTGYAQQTLTYPDLVRRMVDLEQLAVLPPPGETCRQWSSYDRASRYDPQTGKYFAWGANDDGPMFIRTEGEKFVMAEMDGPGCIWRIWSAQATGGHVKIYLDGAEQPAVDLPFAAYFDGKTAPFNYPLLSYDMATVGSRGFNLYYPIPYQKSCKVVAEKDWGRYYQFVYTTFPEGTRVPTFKAQLAESDAAALQRLNDFLAERLGTHPVDAGFVSATAEKADDRPAAQTIAETFTIDAGATEKLVIEGPRAIMAIKANMEFKDRADEMAALRRLVLRITFDDQAKPSVWCPAGDFFGTAPGRNRYKSLATGVTEEGGYAYWYMPFGKRAVVELCNEDQMDRELTFEICHAPLSRPMEQLGHFHCRWHRDICPLPADRQPDWVMLRTEGRGRFCGVMLHVWNPRGGWWGEGDEKFFVDGEKFPSTIGTGSEDYFGYAWCCPAYFERPFHAQSMTEQNRGHQSVLRWHVADNVPFQASFEACIEKYYGNDGGTQYACTPVWYQAPGGSDPIEPVAVDQRWGYCITPPPGGGGYKVAGEPPGLVENQQMGHFGGGKWHADNQLWWTQAKPGDRLEIVFPVKQAGQYEVSVTLTKARDYAVVQLYVDGKKAGETIDLYNPDVIPTPPISLGTHPFDEGEHRLSVEIVGANEKAVKAYMFGLDQILLKAVK